jgi:hypothetical protein
MYFEDAVNTVERPQPSLRKARGFWRKEEPILVEKKVTRGGMWAPQSRWWGLPNFIKIMVGGYGSGKTMVGCKRVISAALQNAPVPVATVSPTFPLARKTVVMTLCELLAGKQSILGRDAFWWTYNRSVHEFKIRYKGRQALIWILSGEDPLSLRGPNIGAAYIDEPFIQDEAVFTQMIARVRHPDAQIRELFMTGTPEQLNWGYDLCVGDKRAKHDVGFVQSSTRDNLALDEDYVPRLEGALSGKATGAYIEGNFVNLGEGLVYYGFNMMKDGNVRTVERPKEARLGAGMDFNVNPMAAAIFWRAGNHLHYFDEIELPNADTEYMCSELRKRYVTSDEFKNNPLEEVFPDASGSARQSSAPGGRSDFTYIREAGFSIRAHHANPKRRDRYNAVNGKLSPKSGPITITIDPNCKKLIKYLSTYSHELMAKQQAMSHLLDAYGYPVAYLFPAHKDVLSVHKLQGF